MNNQDSVRNKIIILYIISRLPGITSSELISISIDTCYMNYFEYANVLEGLVSGKFITESTRKGEERQTSDGKPVTRYDITPMGNDSLEKLRHLIPVHIHLYLNKTFGDWDKTIKKDKEIRAVCDPDLFGGYEVKLSLNDGSRDLFNLNLSVPDKDLANKICNKWKDSTQVSYTEILRLLSE